MLVHDFPKCLTTRDDQLARMDKRNLPRVVIGGGPQKLIDVSVSEERTEVVYGVRSLDWLRSLTLNACALCSEMLHHFDLINTNNNHSNNNNVNNNIANVDTTEAATASATSTTSTTSATTASSTSAINAISDINNCKYGCSIFRDFIAMRLHFGRCDCELYNIIIDLASGLS